MRFTDIGTIWIMVWVLICIIAMIFIGLPQPPVVHDVKNVTDLRRMSRECAEMDDRHVYIKTIWDAPVGQPRKPVRWEVTCKKNR